MNEYLTIWQFAVAMLGLVAGCVLYSMGGRSGKWKRRFIGSFIIASTFVSICIWRGLFNWWLLTTYPALVTTFSLGYSGGPANSLVLKLIKRSMVVLAVLTTGLA